MRAPKDTPSISEDEYQELLRKGRRASSAPPPIQPIAGCGSSTHRRPDAIKPKWDEWRMLGVVLPWEAAALSIDLEPRSINQWQSKTFPDDEAFDRFQMCKRIIEAQPGWHLNYKIRLAEFLDWAAKTGFGVPDDLHRLVSKQMPESDCMAAVPIADSFQESAVEGRTSTEMPASECNSSGKTQKPHIKYLAALHHENPAATAKELRNLCLDRAKAIKGGDVDQEFPFQLQNNDLALKGTKYIPEVKTFANWVSQAKTLD